MIHQHTVDRRDEKASRRHEADHLTHERGVDRWVAVTPNFKNKTECISYMRQDQIYKYMIDFISEYIKGQCSKRKQKIVHNFITLRYIISIPPIT